MDTRELRRELDTIKSSLVMQAPFVMSLLNRCRIILDPNTQKACVNAANEIRVNPEFIAKLGKRERAILFAEQALHIALQHAQRMRGKDEKLFNIAACCSVHALLNSHQLLRDVQFPQGASPITPEVLAQISGKPEKEIATMTAEEIYQLLKQLESQELPSSLGQFQDLSSESSSQNQDSQGDHHKIQSDKPENGNKGSSQEEVVHEGDQSAYDKDVSPQEKRKYWEEAMVQAYMEAKKIAGSVPAGLEREIGELFRPQVPWLSEINKALTDGIGKTAVSTWVRASRKHPLLPGNRFLTLPTIWSAVDGSASVDEKELAYFLSIVALHCKTARQGIVVPWDAEVYPPIVLRKPSDAARKLKTIAGGGGTMIYPALEFLKKNMRPGDIVVIITDGHVFDIEETATQDALRVIARKSGVAIFATNDKIPALPRGWRKIKIESHFR